MKQTRKPLLVTSLALALVVTLVGAVGYAKFHHTAPAAVATHQAKAVASVQPAKQTDQEQQPEQPVAHVDASLQQIIDTWALQHSFASSVTVQELSGNLRTAGRNQDTAMTTA